MAVSAAVGYARLAAPHALPLPHAVVGTRRESNRRAGRLSYFVAGTGAPVLLIHSINAAGSAYEVKPIYEDLIGDHRTYAVDLPGFGFSDRSDRRYDIRLYVDAIHDMVDEIVAEHGPGPVDVLALSLSAEYLARAAAERPEAFRSLTLVTPTGFQKGSNARRGAEGGSREIPALHRALTIPVWSRGLYNLLVTRPSIRYFLERTWGSKRIDEGLLDYDYLTTHQPGAKNAPYAFLSGRLFSGDIRNVYERLTVPVLILHGTRGDFRDFSESGWTRSRPNWRIMPFDSGALPHFEHLGEFMSAFRKFVAAPPR
jgi:pimeloyl-ACP methyl ester carboxylesterase